MTTQLETEDTITAVLSDFIGSGATPLLQTSTHTAFLTHLLKSPLPAPFTGLDASRPWLIYWACHSLALFDGELDGSAKTRIVDTLKRFQNVDGGFGGGPGQLSHLAPTYASVAALCYVGEEGWAAIDRSVSLLSFSFAQNEVLTHSFRLRQSWPVSLLVVFEATRRIIRHAYWRRGRCSVSFVDFPFFTMRIRLLSTIDTSFTVDVTAL